MGLVFKINYNDIRPLVSHRYHLPPTAHCTFVCPRFVVCTFVPRPIETDEGALKVPFFHSNDDYDELLFYHRGSFFSRDNVKPGCLSFHPFGFPHGPHPNAFKAQGMRQSTDEVAVMIDCRDPVSICPPAASAECVAYVHSWTPHMNPCRIKGLAFVEFSGRPAALHATFHKFGLSLVSQHKEHATAILLYNDNDINFAVNTLAGSFAAQFEIAHGPCACAMGWTFDDAEAAFETALSRGATPFMGELPYAGLKAIVGVGGSLLYFLDDHTTQLKNFFVPHEKPMRAKSRGMLRIDHLTNNVAFGTMKQWAEFYVRVFAFTEVRTFTIRGRTTGLKSYALRSPDGSFCIPINESNDAKSQINEYLEEYNGAGIQHIAFLTKDIVTGIETLSREDFLDIDDAYYEDIFDIVPNVQEDRRKIQEFKVLVDGDDDGYLLQIFTRNVIGPIFFEIIQRNNHAGFGEGNFGALFRSVERDQARRGYL